jgi:virginiamycin B lyase
MSRTGIRTNRSAARRGAPGPKSPRGGTRGQRVAASLVVIGLLGGVALFANGVAGHGKTGPSPAAGFPKPTAVPTTNSVLKPSRSGRVTAWPLPEALVSPRDVDVSVDGVVWITEQDRGKVDSLKDGTLTRYGTDAFPYMGAFGLGAGPGGTMWFTGYPGGSIARVLPDGTANGFAPLGQGSTTVSVAEGNGDVMWVTDTKDALLVRIGPDGSVAEIPVTAPAGSAHATPQPYDIVRGADGTMWFTDPGTSSVGSVSTGSVPTVTEHPVAATAQPRSIALAPDGTLWITDREALAKIDPSDGSATVVHVKAADGTLNDLLVASDGTIWMSEDGPYLLHVNPDGSLIERVKLPQGAKYADGIAQAPDGTIWAAATDANLIVSVAPGG